MDELLVALAHLNPHSGIMTEGGQFFDGANDTDSIQDDNDEPDATLNLQETNSDYLALMDE